MTRIRITAAILVFLVGFSTVPTQASNQNEELRVWEPCEVVKTAPCIISVQAISKAGKITTATTNPNLSRDYEDAYASQPILGKKYEWVTPGIKHENGTEQTILKIIYWPLGKSYCWAEGQCATNLDQIIFSYGGGWWNTPNTYTDFPDLLDDRVCGSSVNPTYCTKGWGLNPDYLYRVKAKLPANFDFGFSIGYGKQGSILVEKEKNGDSVMTVSVTPAQKSYKWRKYNDVTPTNFQQKADVTDNIVQSALHGVSDGSVAWLSRCEYGRGMSIWSNGDIIQYPSWNNDEKVIQLQVAAMATKADGTRNQGTFEVAVPIKIAQCLWGVDLSKSVSAIISASYPELGISEVITTSSRVENGMYYLNASGFHYSAPTIKVKVVQTNPQPSTEIKKKSTITCVKGKVVKKVSAVSPKCPAGYKKK
jgi:hypothetical protein